MKVSEVISSENYCTATESHYLLLVENTELKRYSGENGLDALAASAYLQNTAVSQWDWLIL
jgi:hypothetical protein